MDCIPPGSSLPMGFFRQEYWNELLFPSPGDFPHPGIIIRRLVFFQQNKILKLTESNKWLKKDKIASKAPSSTVLAPLSQILPPAPSFPFLLYHLYLLYILNSPTMILSLNFHFPLKFYLLPFLLNLSEPVSLKSSLQRTQRLNPSVQFSSVAQSCPTLCNPMNRSTPGLPVHDQLPEFTQIHVHWVSGAIQPSHPLSSPSPPAPNPSQHQGLFQWVNSSHEVAKVLEFQL